MDNNFNSFEEIMKACGYCFDEDGNIDLNNDNFDKENHSTCKDMSGGFQQIYPSLFVLVGEVIGAIISQKLPINVQDSFGNWLQLIGQVILTYNAQQQYYQGGPGRYFNPENYNIQNTLCSESEKSSSKDQRKIKNLEKDIKRLKSEIEQLKQKVDKY